MILNGLMKKLDGLICIKKLIKSNIFSDTKDYLKIA